MLTPLMETKRGSKVFNFLHSLETDEYTKSQHTYYVSDILKSLSSGSVYTYYRLHSNKPMTVKDALSCEVHCPKCGRLMQKIDIMRSENELCLYECTKCNERE